MYTLDVNTIYKKYVALTFYPNWSSVWPVTTGHTKRRITAASHSGESQSTNFTVSSSEILFREVVLSGMILTSGSFIVEALKPSAFVVFVWFVISGELAVGDEVVGLDTTWMWFDDIWWGWAEDSCGLDGWLLSRSLGFISLVAVGDTGQCSGVPALLLKSVEWDVGASLELPYMRPSLNSGVSVA